MPSTILRLLKWLLVPILIGSVIYWKRTAPLPARLATVVIADIVGETMGTGTLQARISATISPQRTGRLAIVLVDQGDRVTAGQELARMDDTEALRQYEVAEASFAAASATVQRVRTEEARSQAVLRQARLEHERALSLAANQSMALSERDKAVEQLNIAEAEAARAAASIIEAESLEATARSQVALQRELLDQTQLRAPFDGLVIRRDRDPGEIVSPGGSVLQIVDPTEIWVSAWVDETAIARVTEDQPARIVFRSEPDTPYPGHVARLGRETDRETREFIVDVAVDRLPRHWTIGQRAEAYFETEYARGAMAIPNPFVVTLDNTLGVFVLRNDRARWQPITLGLRGAHLVEVQEGLDPDDEIAMPVKPGTNLSGHRIASP